MKKAIGIGIITALALGIASGTGYFLELVGIGWFWVFPFWAAVLAVAGLLLIACNLIIKG